MKRWGILLLCSVIATVFAGGWTSKKAPAKPDDDFIKITSFADAHMEQGWHLTVRVSGTAGGYRDAREVEQLGVNIAETIGLNGTGGRLDLSGTIPVYRLQTDATALGQLSIMAAGSDNQASRFVIVRLDASSQAVLQTLAAWQTNTRTALQDSGLKPEMNVIAQGELRQSNGSSNKMNPELVAAEAAAAFGAAPKERYTDFGTLSVSYDAPTIQSSVQSGGHRISLQTALHQDSTSGSWRMTIGTPVITTEY